MLRRPLLRPLPPLAWALPLLVACSGGGDEAAPVPLASIQGAPLDAPVTPPKVVETLEVVAETPVARAEPAPKGPADGGTEPAAGEPADEQVSVGADATEAPAAAEAAPPGGHGSGHGASGSASVVVVDGVHQASFEVIAFEDYEPPELRDVEEPLSLEEFPEAVRQLDGLEVALDGYMVPVDFEDRMVTSFILSRYLPGCCFGVMPMMDEWVEVEVATEEGVEYLPYQIVRVVGTFEVGELLDDYGYVRSIYRLRAKEVQAQQ